ncbi:Alpha/Beta hydrolase protein [Aspergillus heterothallicus]
MPKTEQVAPYEAWPSPITAAHLSSGSIHIEGVQTNPSTGQVYVLESRPAEEGRHAIVELTQSYSNPTTTQTRDVLPAKYSAMGAVHEYGGGSFLVHPGGRSVLFTDYPRNGVFSLNLASGEAETIVPPDPSVRFGDFNVYPGSREWILAVRETHSSRGAEKNRIVVIHALTGEVSIIAGGADFYQHPQSSPDGTHVSWIQWDHPDMPWKGSVLGTATVVSGEAGVENICQPRWGKNGTLFFVSDKTGFWQLYRWEKAGNGEEREVKHIQLKGLEEAEFGSREPCLGNCTYVLLDEKTLIASAVQNATANLIKIDLTTNTWDDLEFPLVDIQKNALAGISSTSFALIGSTRTAPQALYHVDICNKPKPSIALLYDTTTFGIEESLISPSQHITFPRLYSITSASISNGAIKHAHAIFNSPTNPSYTPLPDTIPPLLIWMHGGPTTHITPALSLAVQYWTSRGYAYASVNHVGSTGYGRCYRAALDGRCGVEDIADAASCVAYLAKSGLIDESRVGIIGESAGGYATAGVGLYGTSDLAGFAEITHIFESRYIIGLKERVYRERSAVSFTDKVTASLLLLQGDQDTIVPLGQAVQMEKVLKGQGKTVEMIVLKGEGHGRQKSETMRRSLEATEGFWKRMLL